MTLYEPAIARFDPISLPEMDGVKLQDRVDTKYVFAERLLPQVLERMLPDHRMLEVDGTRGTRYRSLYLDTPELTNYHDHHNQRTFRSKVRYREYLGSGLTYLEVKRKTGRGRTDKARMRVEGIPAAPTAEHLRFIAEAGGAAGPLVPTLWNHFTRYTFVRREGAERLTMDVGLRFSGPDGERVRYLSDLGGVVVAELKQARIDRTSPFARLMRERGIRPSGMSKYCVGMLMLGPSRYISGCIGRPVKHNGFKPVLLMLDRVRRAA